MKYLVENLRSGLELRTTAASDPPGHERVLPEAQPPGSAAVTESQACLGRGVEPPSRVERLPSIEDVASGVKPVLALQPHGPLAWPGGARRGGNALDHVCT